VSQLQEQVSQLQSRISELEQQVEQQVEEQVEEQAAGDALQAMLDSLKSKNEDLEARVCGQVHWVHHTHMNIKHLFYF